MYLMGIMDTRIRPFVFLVRRWAYEFKITQYGSRDTFTNFQLSYMALSFLQNVREPVLPTATEICKQHKIDSNGAIARHGNSFLFDINQITFKTKNTSTIFELFLQFLEFYDSYDLGGNMITLRTTEKIPKNDPSPLYLENIFDPAFSWGGNVSEAEVNTFKIMTRETLQELTQCFEKNKKNEKWGLLELFSHLENK